MKKRVFSVLTACLISVSLGVSSFAHSGRTDASGGHRDNKNKSGLGGYHYHCGGYPAHLHTSGVCPYRGGSSGGYLAPKTVYATGITAQNVPTQINIGDTITLSASVYPSNAEDKTIFWESSDTGVLDVSSSGVLSAVGIGTATVTAKTSRGTSKNFIITVCEVVASEISIANNNSRILIGDSQILECRFTPENTTDKSVIWTSSDESAVSVSPGGEITANKIGTATITAIHRELTCSIDIEVMPIDAQSIEIILPDNARINNDGHYEIKKDSKMNLSAEIKPDNTTYKNIEWQVSDESIAFIDENGILTAKSTGVVSVAAIAESGVADEIEIEVYSETAAATAGIAGLLVVGGGAATLYYRRKKKKETQNTEIW